MAYGVITPGFWDDEKLADLGLEARLVAVFLLTGRQATLIPGIVNLGVAGLSEAARLPMEAAAAGLAELERVGFAEVDARRRLIRIPNAPRYNPPANGNMLRGWYHRWKTLPDCPIKARHVASFKQAVKLEMPSLSVAWGETFGTVPEPVDVVPETVGETVAEPFANGSKNRFETSVVGVSVSVGAVVSAPEASAERKPRQAAPASPEAAQVAEYLLAAIRSHTPEHRADPAKWVRDVDLALRADKHSAADLRLAIDQAHRSPDPFWRSNVLSGKKLREHAPSLLIRARASPPGKAVGGLTVQDLWRKAQEAELEEATHDPE